MVFVGVRRKRRLIASQHSSMPITRLPSRHFVELSAFQRRVRKATLFLIAWPALILFYLFAIFILLLGVQFNAWLVYSWGDCLHLPCRDSQYKHGFFGWL